MLNVKVLRDILAAKSVRWGKFTLASGKESDFYVDVRQTSLSPEGALAIARLLHQRLHPQVVAVGGLTLGADPIACAVSTYSALTSRPIAAFLVRKEAKAHGTGARIEGLGNVPPGSHVAVVEDTTTTGKSMLQAIEAAQQAGLIVVQVLTIVDRQEGAEEFLQGQGYTLESLITREDLEPESLKLGGDAVQTSKSTERS
jgi:orotate phosphoribosyltransferase